MRVETGAYQCVAIVHSRKEKNQLFKKIKKRDPVAHYFLPNGKEEWHYPIDRKEAEMLREQTD